MPRILLVEDYPALARVAIVGLGRAGHDVHWARSVAAALAEQGTFDGAVIDMELPDGSGIEVAQALSDAGRVGPIVFYTGMSLDDERRRALAFGPVFPKAEGLQALLDELELMLEQRRARARAVGGVDLPAENGVTRSGTRPRTR